MFLAMFLVKDSIVIWNNEKIKTWIRILDFSGNDCGTLNIFSKNKKWKKILIQDLFTTKGIYTVSSPFAALEKICSAWFLGDLRVLPPDVKGAYAICSNNRKFSENISFLRIFWVKGVRAILFVFWKSNVINRVFTF